MKVQIYNKTLDPKLWDKECPTCKCIIKYKNYISYKSSILKNKLCRTCCCKLGGLKRRLNIQKFIEKSKKIHGEKYDYSKVNYKNNLTNVCIICPIHGDFYQLPLNHMRDDGCKLCSYIEIGKKNSITKEEFIQSANKIHNFKYNYSKVDYKNNLTKIEIICPNHGKFKQLPCNHLSGKGCSKCKHIISKPEIEFLDYLNIKDRNITLKDWKQKRVDGIDISTNTIYEFLGDYWHGNPEKFDGNNIHPICKISYKKLYQNTFSNFDKLKILGYNVKYIWENDWKNFKKGKDFRPNIITL